MGLSLSDDPFVSFVGYTMLSSSNSSFNMLWECSSSWTNTEPLAICWLYVSFVDFLEGLDVPVTIKIDFGSLQATPIPIIFSRYFSKFLGAINLDGVRWICSPRF